VETAGSGRQALALIRRITPDAILADLRLPDISVLELLREVRRDYADLPFVVITGFGPTMAAAAMRLGANHYVEEPLIGDAVLQAVEKALTNVTPVSDPDAWQIEAHAAKRWAEAIVPILNAGADPRTLAGWSRCAGVSQGTLKTWCRMACVSPKRSLNLGRLLRAIRRRESHGYPLQESLDVVDARTLAALVKAGGVTSGDAMDVPTDVNEFLRKQSLVRNPLALRELRRQMKVAF
jgi:CheY-like chemotaxis protein